LFIKVEEAIRRFAAGEILILVDDENRENEGDLVIAAEHVSPEAINFMATYGRGLICAPISEGPSSPYQSMQKKGSRPVSPPTTALRRSASSSMRRQRRMISPGRGTSSR